MSVVTSTVFAGRNFSKTANGDIGRAPVAPVQLFNAMKDLSVMKEFGKISDGAAMLMDKVDDAAKATFGVSNAATKIAKVTTWAVNPLLCVASGIRVIKDDDKKSALTEEALAMGTMFSAEYGVKQAGKAVRKIIDRGNVDNILKDGKLKDICNSGINKIKNIQGSNGGKIALGVASSLLFVAASVCAFDVGKKIGKKITGREKAPPKETPPDNPIKSKNPFDMSKTGQIQAHPFLNKMKTEVKAERGVFKAEQSGRT